MFLLLLIVLALMVLTSAPMWPYSHEWGYLPSAGIAVIFVLVVTLAVLHIF